VAWDRTATIIVAIGDNRPAVIETRLDEIELITTARSHFVLPQFAVRRECQTIGIAVPRRPGQRFDATFLSLRIVLWG
jgi:hypothetical protein